MRKPRPKFFYGWFVVIASILAGAVQSGGSVWGASVFVAHMTDELGWARSAFFGAFTLRAVVGGVLSPFIGPLQDTRSGPRILMLLTGLTMGFSLMGPQVGRQHRRLLRALWRAWGAHDDRRGRDADGGHRAQVVRAEAGSCRGDCFHGHGYGATFLSLPGPRHYHPGGMARRLDGPRHWVDGHHGATGADGALSARGHRPAARRCDRARATARAGGHPRRGAGRASAGAGRAGEGGAGPSTGSGRTVGATGSGRTAGGAELHATGGGAHLRILVACIGLLPLDAGHGRLSRELDPLLPGHRLLARRRGVGGDSLRGCAPSASAWSGA